MGNMVYNGCKWGILVVLAKLGSPELVGRYGLALALTAPIFMFSNLSLATIQASDARDRNVFGDFLGLRLLCSLASLLIISAVVWSGGYGHDVVLVTLWITLAKLAESVGDVAYGLMQKQQRMDLVSRSMAAKGLLSLATLAVTLRLTGSLSACLAAVVLVWTIVLFLHDLPMAGRWGSIRPVFDRKILASLFWLALPLGFVTGLNSLGQQLPRYAMEHYFGQRELGLFIAILAVGMLPCMIAVALSRSVLPRLSQYYAKREFAHFRRLLVRLTSIGAGVGLVGVLGAAVFGRAFLRLVYTEEYADGNEAFMVIMIFAGVVSASSFLGAAAISTRRFAVQVPVHAAKVTLIGLVCFWAIPVWGARGAAWALVAGALFSSVAYLAIVCLAVRSEQRKQRGTASVSAR